MAPLWSARAAAGGRRPQQSGRSSMRRRPPSTPIPAPAPVRRSPPPPRPRPARSAPPARPGRTDGAGGRRRPHATTGITHVGGYAGQGPAAACVAGRTVADLITERQSEFTALLWVRPMPRRGEPEPLRWIGANGLYEAYSIADRMEARSGGGSTAWSARSPRPGRAERTALEDPRTCRMGCGAPVRLGRRRGHRHRSVLGRFPPPRTRPAPPCRSPPWPDGRRLRGSRLVAATAGLIFGRRS